MVKVVDQQFLKNYFAAATRKIDLKAKTKCTTRFSTLKTIYLDSLREKIKFSRLLFSKSKFIVSMFPSYIPKLGLDYVTF